MTRARRHALVALAWGLALGCTKTSLVGAVDSGGLDASDAPGAAAGDGGAGRGGAGGTTSDAAPEVSTPDAARDADAANDAGAEAPLLSAVVACSTACTSAGGRCDGDLCDDGVDQWPTLGGDIHHSGFARYETGKPPLTKAWTAALIGTLSPVVVDDTTVYVTSGGPHANTSFVAAVTAATGRILWRRSLDMPGGIGFPTVDHGHLYLGQCLGSTVGLVNTIVSMATATGDVEWSQPIDCQLEQYWSPLVVGGALYADAGEYGGMTARRASDGAELYFEMLPQVDAWSPLYLGGQIYTFLDGDLAGFDALTGAPRFSATVPWSDTYSAQRSPVSDGARIYVTAESTLFAYRPGATDAAWDVIGGYTGQAAVGNGVVYALSGGQLRAHDATTGKVDWTFPADTELTYPPVIAGRWVYVASGTDVYAIDTEAQDVAWRAQPGGWLSIANGRLYVSQSDGHLVAYTMSP